MKDWNLRLPAWAARYIPGLGGQAQAWKRLPARRVALSRDRSTVLAIVDRLAGSELLRTVIAERLPFDAIVGEDVMNSARFDRMGGYSVRAEALVAERRLRPAQFGDPLAEQTEDNWKDFRRGVSGAVHRAPFSTADLLALAVIPDNDAKWMAITRAGLPYTSVVQFMARTGIRYKDLIEALDIHERSLRRRKEGPLLPHESERLIGLAMLYSESHHRIGTAEAATAWWVTPQAALSGHRPISLATTSFGRSAVAELIADLRG